MDTWSNIEDFLEIAEKLLGKLPSLMDLYPPLKPIEDTIPLPSLKPLKIITPYDESETYQERWPLHDAAYFGRIESIQELIHRGLVVEVEDHFGNTPLDYALGNCKWKAAKLLLIGDRHIDRCYLSEHSKEFRGNMYKLQVQKSEIYSKPIKKQMSSEAPPTKYTPAETVKFVAHLCIRSVYGSNIEKRFGIFIDDLYASGNYTDIPVEERKKDCEEIVKILKELHLSCTFPNEHG